MRAGELRPHKAGTGLKVNAAVAVQPLKQTGAVIDNLVRQSRISLALRHLHHVVEERFIGVVGGTGGLLERRVEAQEEPSRVNGVAERHIHLFQQQWL